MCDSETLKEYANWVSESSSKEELLDALRDIRDDLTAEDDSSDDEGGRQLILKY